MMDLWERRDRVVIVDVETTGLSVAHGGRVIEIGLVAVENGYVVAEFDTLIDCEAVISDGAFRVHGISESMLTGQPSPSEVWPQVAEFIGTTPLVAHNAPFDRSFVSRELALLGQAMDNPCNPWHCTVQRHRALDDARLTAWVWVELAETK